MSDQSPVLLPAWAETRMGWLWLDVRDLEALLRNPGAKEAVRYMGDLEEIAARLDKVVQEAKALR